MGLGLLRAITQESFMLQAIAAMVVVLGIGFLMAHALDAFRSDTTLPARKIVD